MTAQLQHRLLRVRRAASPMHAKRIDESTDRANAPSMRLTSLSEQLTDEDQAWLAHDDELRRRASVLALELGRNAEDLYKTLRHLERTPSERLALGLRHGRLGRSHRT